jgi:hypothetical protein
VPEVVADLEAGVLRLSRPALEALASMAGPSLVPPAEETLGDLRAAGLLSPAGLHPMMEPIAAAVAHPVVRLRFDYLGPGTPVECPGWISSVVAVLALPGPDGLDEIVAVDTSFLPNRLAVIVGLGPRPGPRTSGSVRADVGLLEALISGMVTTAEDVRRHVGPVVPQPLLEAVLELSQGIRRHWRVLTTWGQASPPAVRSHEVVEGPTGEFWLVRREFGGTELSPITPTGLWRLFIGLLPGDAEL